MPWVKSKSIEGLVYVPEYQPENQRKYLCPDCYFCQMCSDTRCGVCKDIDTEHSCKNTSVNCKDNKPCRNG